MLPAGQYAVSSAERVCGCCYGNRDDYFSFGRFCEESQSINRKAAVMKRLFIFVLWAVYMPILLAGCSDTGEMKQGISINMRRLLCWMMRLFMIISMMAALW